MRPRHMTAVIDRKRYDTEKGELIAGDDHWDGSNYERRGRNTFLYRTDRGSYFAVHLTCWQNERDRIEPLELNEAIKIYEALSKHYVEFEEAFPDIAVQDA